jgi:hypothetical protein
MLDIFSNENTFLIKNRGQFKTALGGFLSCGFLALSFAIIIYILNDYLSKGSPILIKYQETNEGVKNWKSGSKFILTYSRNITNQTNLVSWDKDAYEYRVFNTTECTDDEYFKYFPLSNRSPDMINLCLETYVDSAIEYCLLTCSQAKNFGYVVNLLGRECDSDPPDIVNIYWSFLLVSYHFNSSEKIPLKEETHFFERKEPETPNYYYTVNSHNKFINDIGIFDEYLEIFYFHDFIYEEITYDDSLIFDIYLYNLNDEYFVFHKSFIKFPDLIAKIIALITLLNIIIKSINSYFSQFHLTKYFLDLFLKKEEVVPFGEKVVEIKCKFKLLLF